MRASDDGGERVEGERDDVYGTGSRDEHHRAATAAALVQVPLRRRESQMRTLRIGKHALAAQLL